MDTRFTRPLTPRTIDPALSVIGHRLANDGWWLDGDGDKARRTCNHAAGKATGHDDARRHSSDGMAMTLETARILVVDDDPHVRETIRLALEEAGMDVAIAGNGSEGIAHFIVRPCDLIVLDVGMPEMDGLEMCRRIRRSSEVPILFLSARDEEIDRILGLEIGGDDYVAKPFSTRELVARIKAILKRNGRQGPGGAAEPLRHGDLSLDPAAHRAALNGRPVGLTALEFGIVQGLMSRPAVVFRRNQIVAMAYGANMHVSDRTVDSHIRNIRAKMLDAGCGNVIETVHGVGFRLGPCTAD